MNDDLRLVENLFENTENNFKIYSKKAIFGPVHLNQDIKNIGKKIEANLLLLLSIFFAVFSINIVNIPEITKLSFPFSCLILTLIEISLASRRVKRRNGAA